MRRNESVKGNDATDSPVQSASLLMGSMCCCLDFSEVSASRHTLSLSYCCLGTIGTSHSCTHTHTTTHWPLSLAEIIGRFFETSCILLSSAVLRRLSPAPLSRHSSVPLLRERLRPGDPQLPLLNYTWARNRRNSILAQGLGYAHSFSTSNRPWSPTRIIQAKWPTNPGLPGIHCFSSLLLLLKM